MRLDSTKIFVIKRILIKIGFRHRSTKSILSDILFNTMKIQILEKELMRIAFIKFLYSF